MKKFLVILTLIVVLLIAIIALMPSFINWNKYKPQIANQINQAIGREVIIDGEVSFRLFPYPFLSLGQTRVRNIRGSTRDSMANIKNIEIRVEPYSLLKGEIRMRRISLIEPEIFLEVLSNGEVNWNFSFLQKQDAADFNDSFGNVTVKNSVILDSVTIQNGAITYSNKKIKFEENLEGITAEIIAGSLKGPYRVDGNLNVRDRKAGFALSLGTVGTDNPTEINFTISELTSEAFLNMSGIISNISTGSLFDGNVSVNVQKIPVLLSIFNPDSYFPKSLDSSLALNSSFSYKTGQFNVEDIVLKYGDMAAAGSAVLVIDDDEETPEIDSNLYFTQLKLEPFINALNEMRKDNRPLSRNLRFPNKINAKIGIGAGIISYKDGNIRDLEAKTILKKGAFIINESKTTMIGNTNLAVSGEIVPEEGLLQYDLDIDFSSDNTRQLLRWLGQDEKIASDAVFRNGSFKGNLKGSPEEMQITDMAATLDRTKVLGNLKTFFGERKVFEYQLNVDDLNLDSYFLPKQEKTENLIEATKNNFVKLNNLLGFDFKGKANISSLVYNDLPVRGLSFDGSLTKGSLLIEEFNIQNLAGLITSFKGQVSGFGQEPVFKDFYYSIEGENLSPLMSRLEWKMPFVKNDELGAMNFSGILNGSWDNLSFDSLFEAKGASIKSKGLFEKKEEENYFNFDLEASHLNFNNFVRIFNKNYNPEGGNLGVFKFTAKMEGNKDNFKMSTLDLGVGLNKLNGDIEVNLQGERPKFVGKTTALLLQPDKFFPKDSFNVFNQTANNNIAKDIEQYILSSAVFIPNPSESLLIKTQTNPRFSTGIKAKPSMSMTEFKTDLMAYFDLDIEAKAEKLEIFSYLLDKTEFKIKLEDKHLELLDFQGKYREGYVSGMLKLDAKETVEFSGEVDLYDIEGKKDFFGTNIVDISNGYFSMPLEFKTSGKNQKEFIENINAGGNFTFKNPRATGFDLKAINDEIKDKRDPKDIEDILTKYTEGGETYFDLVSGDFDITNGTIEADNIEMQGEDGNVKIALKLNIREWLVDYVKTLQVVNQDIPPFSIKISGDAERSEFTLDFADFEKYFSNLEEYDIRVEKERLEEEARIKQEKLEEEARIKQEKFEEEQAAKKEAIVANQQLIISTNEKVMVIASDAQEALLEYQQIFADALLNVEKETDLVAPETYLIAKEMFDEKDGKKQLNEVDNTILTTLEQAIKTLSLETKAKVNEVNLVLENLEFKDEHIDASSNITSQILDLLASAEEKSKELELAKEELVTEVKDIEKAVIRYIKIAVVLGFKERITTINDEIPSIVSEAQKAIDEAELEFSKIDGDYALTSDVDVILEKINQSQGKIAQIKDEIWAAYSKAEASYDLSELNDLVVLSNKKEQDVQVEKEATKRETQKLIVLVNQIIADVQEKEEQKRQLLDMLPGRNMVKPKEQPPAPPKQQAPILEPQKLLQQGELRLERTSEIIVEKKNITNEQKMDKQPVISDIVDNKTSENAKDDNEVGGSLIIHKRR